MKAALWFRVRAFATRHANKIWLCIVVSGVTLALVGIRNEGTERREQICDALTNGQRVDRLLIDTVLETPTRGIPLLDVESFGSLPPAVQTYVRDLASEASAPTPDAPASLAERLEAFRDENLGADDLPEYCRPG